jgi:Fe-S cluster assembly scaffold protein SufB
VRARSPRVGLATLASREADAHAATDSKGSDEQVFHLRTRGLSESEATMVMVNGFGEPIVVGAKTVE